MVNILSVEQNLKYQKPKYKFCKFKNSRKFYSYNIIAYLFKISRSKKIKTKVKINATKDKEIKKLRGRYKVKGTQKIKLNLNARIKFLLKKEDTFKIFRKKLMITNEICFKKRKHNK